VIFLELLMNSAILTSYNPVLVALSFLITMTGSFLTLTVAARIRQSDGKLSLMNVLAGGVSLGGVGVWAMHFVGMLALNMDVATSYSPMETAVSLLAAVAGSSLALAFVAQAPQQLLRLLITGFLLGMGVVFMHYMGMFGMRFGGFIQWDLPTIGVSAVVATIAATTALWLAFNVRSLFDRIAAALVMSVAVCTTHYTGMTAAEFVCTTINRNAIPQGFGYMSRLSLPSAVTIAAFAMALLIAIDQFFQRVKARPLAATRPRRLARRKASAAL
jgi:NO-binding membrane sensor protein with MHYT domain